MVNSNRQQYGFTLMEILVTLVIAVILTTSVIPSFSNMIQRSRIATKTNLLVSFLAIARSEAVKQGMPVTVCASSNGTSCTGGSFADGWIVFVDATNAGTVDDGEKILNVQQQLGGGINVTFTPPNNLGYIQFAPTGMLSSACELCAHDERWLVFENTEQTAGPLDKLFAVLSPWSIAHAEGGPDLGNNGEGDIGNGGDTDDSGAGGDPGGDPGGDAGVPEPRYTYILCDSYKKTKGQSVIVYGSGRVSSEPYTCP
ncbi:MAG TPA: prepilin-type N-terminal cleavage/methylation domain-containing protein [Gammaproteobacteria bacterium]|nr:prepilin-type N-terminal cleavage/methylation domain-containing protein [Gammaproteobacteria bacterium]